MALVEATPGGVLTEAEAHDLTAAVTAHAAEGVDSLDPERVRLLVAMWLRSPSADSVLLLTRSSRRWARRRDAWRSRDQVARHAAFAAFAAFVVKELIAQRFSAMVGCLDEPAGHTVAPSTRSEE